MEGQQRFAVGLASAPGIGAKTYSELITIFGSAKAVWEAPENELAKHLRKKTLLQALANHRRDFLFEKTTQEMSKARVALVTIEDDAYPPPLRTMPAPPPLLFYRGNLELAAHPKLITIVGTRAITPYGKRVCEEITGDLIAGGCVPVSGLALGVDAVAHAAAVRAHRPTIAVLGGGLADTIIYPRANYRLAQEILQNNGLLLSVYTPFTRAEPGFFPQRNIILANLSKGTIVIEGKLKSGALITAASAATHGKEVFAVPGSIFSTTSKGPHYLIEQGAQLIQCAEDVLEALHWRGKKENHELPKITDATQQKIHQTLLREPLHADDLARACGIAPQQVTGALQLLELQGYATNSNGLWHIC